MLSCPPPQNHPNNQAEVEEAVATTDSADTRHWMDAKSAASIVLAASHAPRSSLEKRPPAADGITPALTIWTIGARLGKTNVPGGGTARACSGRRLRMRGARGRAAGPGVWRLSSGETARPPLGRSVDALRARLRQLHELVLDSNGWAGRFRRLRSDNRPDRRRIGPRG